jgi:prepilin-type N-terminal cleavage/methylation domain-containing protein
MKIRTKRTSAFTLVEIMIVVAIIGLLATIAVPNFVKARTLSQSDACISNLRQIDSAKQQWALENDQPPSATPALASVRSYIGRGSTGVWPTCPATGSYTINAVSTPPSCTVAAHVLP